MTSSLVGWLLCASLHAGPRLDDANVARGEAAYREGRWQDASEAFAAAYEATGDPTYLYTQAQAERRGGRCALAIELYERFIAAEPVDAAVTAARGYIDECRAALPAAEQDPVAPTAPQPVVAPPPPTDTTTDAAPPRRWSQDPWGAALVGLGAGSIVAGATLVGLAHRGADEAIEASDDRTYGDRRARAEALEIAGATLLPVGAALVVGGIVRWVVLRRRARRSDVAFAIGPRGLVVSGRLPSLAGR